MNITYQVSLWQILVVILPIVWALIKMYFKTDNNSSRLTTVETDFKAHENNVLNLKKDLEDKLDRHKNENNVRLMEINNTAIATKTMVELLVQDKIKK